MSANANDVDLIFLISENSEHPAFTYRRLFDKTGSIDSNVVKVSYLNKLCQSEAGWSYRLYHARPVQEFCRASSPVLAGWLALVNKLVGSQVASRHRLARHIRDGQSLLRTASRIADTESAIAKYLMIEAVFLLPVVYLNFEAAVPFWDGPPWTEALRVANSSQTEVSHQYVRLVTAISDARMFAHFGSTGNFAREIKHLRDRCRTAITRHQGNVFHNGFGERIGKSLVGNQALTNEIAQLLEAVPACDISLIPLIGQWLNLARESHRENLGPIRRGAPLRRKRGSSSGVRFAHYEAKTLRLKAIIPTGGCRVPTCTFCMLPYLARPKLNIDEVISTLTAAAGNGQVRQFTIYTDGSFLDERELTRDEQLRIVDVARQLGAEELLIESLPRFVNAAVIDDVVRTLGPNCRLRIGVGLQSSDALVRRYVTGTPITQRELHSLLEYRRTKPISLRLYLLANKPLMSAAEDRIDLHRSLQFLNERLTAQDIVTVNPLLPTNSTLVEKILDAGFWGPLAHDQVQKLQADLRAKSYAFQLDFGSEAVSTCNDLASQTIRSADHDGLQVLPLDAAGALPWSVLGGLRRRNQWARSAEMEPSAAKAS